jgi:F-type H+-transporting ATPase subunit delta
MQGSSRRSLARVQEAFAARRAAVGSPADLSAAGDDLLAVAGLLTSEIRLRNALADPATDVAARVAVVDRLLSEQVREDALALVRSAVEQRWSKSRELVDALEVLAAQALFSVAEDDGRLDAVEDELFRFGRTVAGEPALRAILTDPAVGAARKRRLLDDLLEGKAEASTRALLAHVVVYPRGRRIEDAIDDLVDLAAAGRSRVVAEVRAAVALTPDQEQRMAAALARIYAREVSLQVEVDPTVIGGAVVTVGDEVIDGSVLHRLEQARRQVAGG